VAASSHMMRKSFARPDRIPHHLIADAARLMRTEPLRRDMLRVERTVDWAQTERDLYLVTCPTLILWGELDRYFPVRLLDRFLERLPAAEAHVVGGAGHSLHDDTPELVHRLLSTFLDPRHTQPREDSMTRRTG
jgi:pimeloyl-ACP methyl ester carboxylesterase